MHACMHATLQRATYQSFGMIDAQLPVPSVMLFLHVLSLVGPLAQGLDNVNRKAQLVLQRRLWHWPLALATCAPRLYALRLIFVEL